MEKLTCYLIDDEERAINSLEFLLDYYCNDKAKVIGSANSFEKAVKYLSKNAPDILFLDIKLGDKTGFELLEKIGKMPNTEIVMVTAYDEHALQAFKYDAVNYLLKPVDPEELKKTVDKISLRNMPIKTNAITAILKTQQERLFFPTSTGYDSLQFKDINFIKGDGSYAVITTISNKEITVSKNLSYFEKVLEKQPQFVRVHKSYIVNVQQVIQIDKVGGFKLILADLQEIPVSPTMKDMVMNLIVI